MFWQTVDSVVKDLQTKVEVLQQLRVKHLTQVQTLQETANNLEKKIVENKREAERAVRIAGKIKELIS